MLIALNYQAIAYYLLLFDFVKVNPILQFSPERRLSAFRKRSNEPFAEGWLRPGAIAGVAIGFVVLIVFGIYFGLHTDEAIDIDQVVTNQN